MHNTVVTVEPTLVEATLVDGRVSMDAEAIDVSAHLSRTVEPDDDARTPIASFAVVTPTSDLQVAVELARVDVSAFVDGFQAVMEGDTDED